MEQTLPEVTDGLKIENNREVLQFRLSVNTMGIPISIIQRLIADDLMYPQMTPAADCTWPSIAAVQGCFTQGYTQVSSVSDSKQYTFN